MNAAAPKVVKSSNRGSAPGERRGGRKKGVPNKATQSIREIARQYTDEAVNSLVAVMRDDGEPAAARVSAANAILDRGYGKPSTVISGDDEGGPVRTITRIELVGVAPA